MTDLRTAAQQAMEALEALQGGCTDSDDGTVEAITVWCPEVIDALRAALADGDKLSPGEPVARFNWNEGKFEWLTKYDYYKHHMKPLYLHPAPAVPEVKAHQIRELVNQLRDIAIKYHDHQSLRDRLAGPVHDLWLLSIKRAHEIR